MSATKWLLEEAKWCQEQLQDNGAKFDCDCWILHVATCKNYKEEQDARERLG